MPLFLAGLLVRGGALAPELVEEALQRQVLSGGSLDTSLLELGALDEPTLCAYLSRASGLPAAPVETLAAPDVQLRRVFPLRLAERHGLVPFARGDRTLHMACCYPVDAALLDEMSFLLSQRIQAHVAPEYRIRLAIESLYGRAAAPRMRELARRLGAVVAPPATPMTPSRPERDAPPPAEWTKSEAVARLEACSDRDEAIEIALRFARRAFAFVAAFGVHGGQALGWSALGADPAAAGQIEQVVQPLDVPSIFQTVMSTGGRYLGPVPDDDLHRFLVSRMGREMPRSAFVQPVTIGSRAVALIYADNGADSVSPGRVAQVMVVVQALGSALERMIRSRKAAVAEVASAAPSEPRPVPERLDIEPIPLPGPQADRRATTVEEPAAVEIALADGDTEPALQTGKIPDAQAAQPEQTVKIPDGPPRSLDEAARAVELLLATPHGPGRGEALAHVAGCGPTAIELLASLLLASAAAPPTVIDALAELGEHALPALLRNARSNHVGERYWAAVLLSRSDRPAARAALEALQGDRDPHVAAVARGG